MCIRFCSGSWGSGNKYSVFGTQYSVLSTRYWLDDKSSPRH